jgi:hypothetical protein
MPANVLLYHQKLARMLSNQADDLIRLDEMLQHSGMLPEGLESELLIARQFLKEVNARTLIASATLAKQ